jgi:hypothetical protein
MFPFVSIINEHCQLLSLVCGKVGITFQLTIVIGTTSGSDTCSAAVNMLSHSQIDTLRTISVIIDSAPNMSGNEAGFVAFFTNSLVRPLYLFTALRLKELACAAYVLNHMEL